MLVRLYYVVATIYTILCFIATYFASIHRPNDVVEKLTISLAILPVAVLIHLGLRWIQTGNVVKTKPRYRYNYNTKQLDKI